MARRSTAGTSGCLIVLLLLIALVIGKCSDRGSESQPAVTTTPANSAPSVRVSVPTVATEPYFVNSQTLNQRSSPNGPVVGKLEIGAAVKIHVRRNGWARISGENEAERWVFEKYLCEGTGCYVRVASAVPVQSLVRTSKAPRASRSYVDGSCPTQPMRSTISLNPLLFFGAKRHFVQAIRSYIQEHKIVATPWLD